MGADILLGNYGVPFHIARRIEKAFIGDEITLEFAHLCPKSRKILPLFKSRNTMTFSPHSRSHKSLGKWHCFLKEKLDFFFSVGVFRGVSIGKGGLILRQFYFDIGKVKIGCVWYFIKYIENRILLFCIYYMVFIFYIQILEKVPSNLKDCFISSINDCIDILLKNITNKNKSISFSLLSIFVHPFLSELQFQTFLSIICYLYSLPNLK